METDDVTARGAQFTCRCLLEPKSAGSCMLMQELSEAMEHRIVRGHGSFDVNSALEYK